MFLYRFDNNPELVHGWTTDKRRVSAELSRLRPRGGTAMYDAVAEAIPLAQSGKHRKKALVIISDGNDTSSRTADPRVAGADPGDRDPGLCDRDRFAGHLSAPRTGWGGILEGLMQTRPRPFPFPIPGPEAAAAAADQSRWKRGIRQPAADRGPAVRRAGRAPAGDRQ